MGKLQVKPGVRFDVIAPAGFRLLGALDRIARGLPKDLTLTCGTEAHPTTDPHTRGCAYDVRTHDLSEAEKQHVLLSVLLDVHEGPDDAPMAVSGGWATRKFFGWIEHPGEQNEHLHVQVRKGIADV